MNLSLGEIVLDARRAIYLRAHGTVVFSGLQEALSVSIAGGLRATMEKVDRILEEYRPDHVVVLGGLRTSVALEGMLRRWGCKAVFHFVSSKPDSLAKTLAESLGAEVHQDFVWGKYRFVETDERKELEVHVFSIVGAPNYSVKVGGLRGTHLPVFVKGLGRLIVPSFHQEQESQSVFKKELARCDLFAIGHQKVLPLGKVSTARKRSGLISGLPVTKAGLSKSKEGNGHRLI